LQKSGIEYSHLRKGIIEMYEVSRRDLESGNNRVVIDFIRGLGERIFRIATLPENGGYGAKLIEKLSSDLNRKYRKGFSMRSLFDSKKFYQSYKSERLDYRLSWSHYRMLMRIKDMDSRKNWEKKCAEGIWSHGELSEKLVSEKLLKRKKIGVLDRPEGELYHYRVYPNFFLNSARSAQYLDLGFNLFSEYLFSNSSNKFPPGTIVKSVKKEKETLLEKTAKQDPDSLYLYKGVLERVVDGDTLLSGIDIGFKNFTRQRIRLRGINSPELDTQEGKRILNYLKRRLRESPELLVKTHRQDKYGRYIGDVFLWEKDKKEENVFKNGIFLNQELLEKGFSRIE